MAYAQLRMLNFWRPSISFGHLEIHQVEGTFPGFRTRAGS